MKSPLDQSGENFFWYLDEFLQALYHPWYCGCGILCYLNIKVGIMCDLIVSVKIPIYLWYFDKVPDSRAYKEVCRECRPGVRSVCSALWASPGGLHLHTLNTAHTSRTGVVRGFFFSKQATWTSLPWLCCSLSPLWVYIHNTHIYWDCDFCFDHISGCTYATRYPNVQCPESEQ